jgi:hypothetical protein
MQSDAADGTWNGHEVLVAGHAARQQLELAPSNRPQFA